MNNGQFRLPVWSIIIEGTDQIYPIRRRLMSQHGQRVSRVMSLPAVRNDVGA
jgi:hypothetical protein